MTSEIRANTLKNRVGLGTVSFTDTGPVVSGIVTATTFVGALTGTASGNPTLTSGANNRVITATGANALTGEANLTFDGSNLSVTGAANVAGTLIFQPGGTAWSTTNTRPQLGRQADGELRLGAGSDSSSIVTFYTSPSAGGTLTERLRITSTGEVNIGNGAGYSIWNTVANDQRCRLQFKQTGGDNRGVAFLEERGDANGMDVFISKSRGGNGVGAINSGDTFGFLKWSGADGTRQHNAAGILGWNNGTIATGRVAGNLSFYTSPDAVGSLTERLRIDSSGRLQIGSTINTSYNQFNGIGLLNLQNNAVDGTVDYTQGIVFTNNQSNAGTWTHAAIVTTGSTGYNGNLIFATDGTGARDNAASSLTERLRIKSSGEVNIGTSGGNSTYLANAQNAGLDVWGDGSAYPTLRLGTEVYQAEGEDIRFGRTDHGASDIRYHSLLSKHDTTGAGNYLQFRIHDAGGSPYTSQKTVLHLNGLGEVWIKDGKLRLGTTSGTDSYIYTSNAAGIIYQADENGHTFQTYDSSWKDRLEIKDDGHVVIDAGYGSTRAMYPCRAWANLSGDSNPATIRVSRGISAVTDLGTGDYRFTFSSAMTDANYSALCSSAGNGGWSMVSHIYSHSNMTTTTVRFSINAVNMSGQNYDRDIFCMAIFR